MANRVYRERGAPGRTVKSGIAARRPSVSSVWTITHKYRGGPMAGQAVRMAKTGFNGFPAEGMQFFRALKRNNRREWFQPRKALYEEHVKAPMIELVAALTADMMRFAPDYVAEPAK